MSVTLLYILTNCFLLKKRTIENFLLVVIFFTIFFHIGYSISIGNIYITMADMGVLYLFLRISFIKLYEKKKTINIFNIILIIFLMILPLCSIINVSLFYQGYKIMPITGDYDLQVKYGNQLTEIKLTYMNIIRLLLYYIFLLTSLFLNSELTNKFKNQICEGIFKIGIVYISIMYIEYILKYLNFYLKISKIIILFVGDYGLHTFGTDLVRYGKVWLQGFTYEPGYSGFAIFLYLLSIRKRRKDYLYQLYGIIIMLLNSSLTSFVLLFCYLYILIKNSKRKIQMILILFGVMILLCLIFDMNIYFSRILNIFIDNQGFTSESIRKRTMLDAIKFIMDNPFLGYGIGSTRSLSFLTSIVLNIGIIGTILWWLFIYRIYKIKKIGTFILVFFIYSILGSVENIYNFYIPIFMILVDGVEE